jgi:hypothetical protein
MRVNKYLEFMQSERLPIDALEEFREHGIDSNNTGELKI